MKTSKGKHQRVVWPGFSYKPHTRHVLKVGRNDACPCQSGKKYKDCHEADGSAWLEKMARDEAERRWREQQGEAGGGKPWYQRLLFWR